MSKRPRSEDVDDLEGARPGRGAEGGLGPVGGEQPDRVSDAHPEVARDAGADRDPLGEAAQVPVGLGGVGHAGDGGEVPRCDAVDLHAGVVALVRGQHGRAHEGRGPGHARHGAQALGQRLRRLNGGGEAPGVVGDGGVVDGDVGVGAEDGAHQLGPEARAHRHGGDEGEDGQRDADEADRRHDADAALGAARAQVAPGDQPLERREGRDATGGRWGGEGEVGHGGSCAARGRSRGLGGHTALARAGKAGGQSHPTDVGSRPRGRGAGARRDARTAGRPRVRPTRLPPSRVSAGGAAPGTISESRALDGGTEPFEAQIGAAALRP